MKKLVATCIILSSFFYSCGDSNQQSVQPEVIEIPSASKKEAQVVLAENKVSVEMAVDGMTCAMGCAKHIENKVAELNGVVSSTVNFEEKIATFEFDKTVTSSKEIQKFIDSMQDGQYKASEVMSHEKVEESDTTETSAVKSVASISQRINISFPEIFTFFIKKIR